MLEIKNKTRKLVKAKVKREYNHHHYLDKNNAIVFHFRPGQHWEIGGEYPGDPIKRIISLNYFYELNRIGVMKGVYING